MTFHDTDIAQPCAFVQERICKLPIKEAIYYGFEPCRLRGFLYYKNVPNEFAVVRAMLRLFRRKRRDDFFKARIAPERVPEGEQL